MNNVIFCLHLVRSGFMILKRGWCILTMVLLGVMGYAQTTDDFSDLNFKDPLWSGDTSDFRFTTSSAVPSSMKPALQLYGSGSDTSMIFLKRKKEAIIFWECWVKLSFNPSVNNHGRIYLTQEQNGTGMCGFFAGIGYNNDLVGLYYDSAGHITTLIEDTNNILNGSVNTLRLRIAYNSGSWYLLSDHTGGSYLQVHDSIKNLMLTADSVCFMIWCKYTSSNNTKFYFDDVFFGKQPKDTVSPSLLSISIPDSNRILLQFSEQVFPMHIDYHSSFTIHPAPGGTFIVLPDLPNCREFEFLFSEPFASGTLYSITISDLKDAAGNIINDTTLYFEWFMASFGDILITEIMADPVPSAGLPEAEYIEIESRLNKTIPLEGYYFQYGTTQVSLHGSLTPYERAIVCHVDDSSLFSDFGPVITVDKLTLKNSGENISILNPAKEIIHFISYTADWHASSYKSDGGYSLEMIDRENPCGGYTNWSSSNDAKGGTPGKENSITAYNPDITAPQPSMLIMENPWTGCLLFSEPLFCKSIHYINTYGIANGNTAVVDVDTDPSMPDRVILTFYPMLLPDSIYTLSIDDTLVDCAGNKSIGHNITFGCSSPPDTFDISFNEVLFDAGNNSVEYLEFYNRSTHIIDLSKLFLAAYDTLFQWYNNPIPLSAEPFVLFPDELAVITSSAITLMLCYPMAHKNRVVENNRLMTLPNTGGVYGLFDETMQLIDLLTYDAGMHFPLLQSTKGVSLEKSHPGMPSNAGKSWHSASATSGYGTPTKTNSQYMTPKDGDAQLIIEPGTISPDLDGIDDYTTIVINGTGDDAFVSIYIFDISGNYIKTIASNALCGNRYENFWDGTAEEGSYCKSGIYVIMAVIGYPDGRKRVKKTPIVIVYE
ncbi:MAG: hypothetical protein RQ866_03330 [Bacteroidales bacterium]|nr:hypothetical protein [Bacteroidales bacterium]